MTLLDDARGLLPELVALRRAIHADPELGLALPRTQQRVLDALEPWELETHCGTGLSSVAAIVRGAHPGPTVLLRADMDALPLTEDTGLDYAATGERMHACGHDLHVAGLVGAAHLLAARREELHGDVLLMFQPAEEIGDGARRMIDEGLLDLTGSRPVAAFGIHVVPGEYGIFSTRVGALMAGAIEVEVTITGQGGHASAPHLTRDPVPAVAELVTALQAFVTRRFDVFDPVVLSVTQLHAGGPARNIISDTATLVASVRVLSHESSARVQAELPVIAREIAAAHGCTAEVDTAVLCPPTVNDAEAVAAVRETLTGLFGEDRVRETPNPVMGSEDFSYVLEQVPGAFLFLRATPADVDLETAAPNHSPHVVFDDAVLADQAVALAAFALERLRD
ncbi:M20 metallopeptidase family protein [Microbacterium saperdae]|uniref:Hippurate hydrolase n=1 Tax=Microbacterium saperdae TaxID=69368 RepID=A0A543BPW7_9MICO|nr:M20 family metallopeptidase [Microbacterium saperdae]TQL86876.1 hippurate hydrolase [Microbacterium saperdae]GGM44730.1 amidohydrolase [Microbacterium saperdae]